VKKKFLETYLNLYEIFVFIISFFYLDSLIFKLDLPKGIVSALVHFALLLIHIGSFVAMKHHNK